MDGRGSYGKRSYGSDAMEELLWQRGEIETIVSHLLG